MNQRLLVSAVGKRNALLQLIKNECRSHSIELVGTDAAPQPPARIEVDHFELAPLANSPSFKMAYSAMLDKVGAAAHLTLIDPEIPLLGEIEQEGLSSSRLLHPITATSRACEDKYAFYELLVEHRVPTIPTSLTPRDAFPFIRKDRCGSAASGFKAFHRPEDVEPHEPENTSSKYIFQPFCHGQHYCVDAYFSLSEGRLVDCCAKAVLDKKNGESYLLRSVSRDRFVETLVALGDILPLRGIVNFDIYEDGSELRVMEINCRIGGNYPASHAFGCNLLKHVFIETFEKSPLRATFSPYLVGAFVSKYFSFTPVYSMSSDPLSD